MEPIRQDELINGKGSIYENESNLGTVGYELRVFRKLPDLLSFNSSPEKRLAEGSVEVTGNIAFTEWGKNIEELHGRDLTLHLEDGRFLDVKVDVMGTIIESKGLYDILE